MSGIPIDFGFEPPGPEELMGRLVTEIARVALPTAMRESMQITGQCSVMSYLSGPRPQKLDSTGRGLGRLARAVQGSHTFNTASGSAGGGQESIRRVTPYSGGVKGEMGVDTFSPFDYPRAWEKTGIEGGRTITPVNAKALRWFSGGTVQGVPQGRAIFARRVSTKAQQPRPFLEPAAKDSRPKMEERFKANIEAAARSVGVE